VQAANSYVTGASVTEPPPGFSDLRYLYGLKGQSFRLYHAAGTGSNPDAAPPPSFAGAAVGSPKPIPRLDVDGLPIVKPPYGVLAAIDLHEGEIKWRVPHGDTPDQVRNHPTLKGMEIPKTGQPGSVGLLVTKTLVILGDPEVTTTAEHPRGALLRAYDKATGRQVGAVYMPAPQSGSPMTYLANGRQYIVVAVSGGPYSGEYLAFGLPKD
jgi:quinoprotein glucose dehydrogenase